MRTRRGADEFSSLIPRGGGGHLLLLRAGEDSLLAVAFQDSVSATIVRTYALEAIRRLDSLLTRAGTSGGGAGEKIQGKRFDNEIDGALTDVFG